VSCLMNNEIRMLIVDDEPVVRESLGSWFEEEGYIVDIAEIGKGKLWKSSQGRTGTSFLIDIKIAGDGRPGAAEEDQGIHPDSIIIIMTAYASVETAVEAMKTGGNSTTIIKPF